MRAFIALAIFVTLLLNAAAAFAAPRRRPKPRQQRPAPAAEASAAEEESSAPEEAPDPEEAPARARRRASAGPEADLASSFAAAGLRLEDATPGPRVAAVLRGTAAEALGLKPGDRLLRLGGRRVQSVGDAAEILASLPPGERLSALVERGAATATLAEPRSASPAAAPRSARKLTAPEAAAARAYLETDAAKGSGEFDAVGFTIASGQSLWIRFPAGIPVAARAGDILEGETSTAMSTDARLDFIGVPQGSKIWVSVVAAQDDGEVRALRLHAYKLQPKGGRVYSCSALAAAVSGGAESMRVSAGGSLVAAVDAEAALLAGADRNFRMRFLKPLTIYEPASFYRAGPGLWFKTVGSDREPAFEVTHVIEDRAGASAGLRPGDRIYSIDGMSAGRLGFGEAIDRLYGAIGSQVALRVQRAGQPRGEKLALTRGAVFRRGIGLKARRAPDGVVVSEVQPGSPAYGAGIRKGYRLTRVGDKPLVELDRQELVETLAGDAAAGGALSFSAPGEKERTVALKPEVYSVPLDPFASLRK